MAAREAAACLGELRRRQGRSREATALEHLDRAERRAQPDNLLVVKLRATFRP